MARRWGFSEEDWRLETERDLRYDAGCRGSLPFHERRKLFREATGISRDPNAEVVDVLCYTNEEFEQKVGSPTIVREAIEKGTRVE